MIHVAIMKNYEKYSNNKSYNKSDLIIKSVIYSPLTKFIRYGPIIKFTLDISIIIIIYNIDFQ